VDDHKGRFGVEPICRVLTEHGVPIAPSGYYAHHARPASARAERDAVVLAEIERVYHDPQLGRGLYGARKVWHQLRREGGVDGQAVPRCQVERLMRSAGLRGVRRGLWGSKSQSEPLTCGDRMHLPTKHGHGRVDTPLYLIFSRLLGSLTLLCRAPAPKDI